MSSNVRVLSDVAPQANVTVPAQTSIGATAALVLIFNPMRKGFSIQNTGTTIIKLGFGSIPTQTVYHVALAACTVADDGTGAAYFDDAYTGNVYAISSAGGGTFVLAEFTTGLLDFNQALDLGLP